MDRAERLALLSRDDEAAAPYAARIPAQQVQDSWQLIEPTGVRLMHGPALTRLLEHIPVTSWLAWLVRTVRLTRLLTVFNRFLGKIRKPLGRFFPNPRVPRRWP